MMRYFLCVVAVIFVACSSESGRYERPPTPVTVAEVKKETVPYSLEAIGILKPRKTVKVKAEVSGTLVESHGEEGADVKEGDLLFKIGSGSYEVKLDKAQANLLKSEAGLHFAKRKLERFHTLAEKEYITQLSIEELEKEVAEYEALVRAYQAEVKLAEFDLSDTTIRAPIDGMIGEKTASVRNHVDQGEELVKIIQTEQLKVTFHLPEKQIHNLMDALEVKKDLEIEVKSQEGVESSGHLSFVDTSVDPKTGTILLRGTIDNQNRQLQPGQYVKVRLKLRDLKQATVPPLAAVQIGQQGHYIYLIKNRKAELMTVTPIYRTQDIVVISEELSSGEQVVTDGQINLVPGGRVYIRGAQ